MTIQMKETGPKGVTRPFVPTIELGFKLSMEERQVEALEHIAVSLSAIDHNIELLATKMEGLLISLAKIAAKP